MDPKKVYDRVTVITWKVDIEPGKADEFTFVARNPSSGPELAWRVHQRDSGGTTSDWVEARGSRRPASVTKLTTLK